jgi:cytochrome b
MDWHYRSGLVVTGLLVFRILWGFVGSDTARFGQFLRGPVAIRAYLRGQLPQRPGHNPLGGWSVLALLLVLVTQVTTGLFSVDVDGMESGPLSYLLDFDQGRIAAEIHEVSFNLLLALVALHLLAIAYHLVFKRHNLTRAMVTGYQAFDDGNQTGLARVGWWRLALSAVLAIAVAYWLSRGGRL